MRRVQGLNSADATCVVSLVAKLPKPSAELLAFLVCVRLAHASIDRVDLCFDALTDSRFPLIVRPMWARCGEGTAGMGVPIQTASVLRIHAVWRHDFQNVRRRTTGLITKNALTILFAFVNLSNRISLRSCRCRNNSRSRCKCRLRQLRHRSSWSGGRGGLSWCARLAVDPCETRHNQHGDDRTKDPVAGFAFRAGVHFIKLGPLPVSVSTNHVTG